MIFYSRNSWLYDGTLVTVSIYDVSNMGATIDRLWEDSVVIR